MGVIPTERRNLHSRQHDQQLGLVNHLVCPGASKADFSGRTHPLRFRVQARAAAFEMTLDAELLNRHETLQLGPAYA
jgi:hypothetical protein